MSSAVPAVVSGFVNPSGVVGSGGTGRSAVVPAPPVGALTPAQVQVAYGFSQIPFLLKTGDGVYNNNAGKGQTIAIVDPYSDPSITGDLAAFSSAYGLPQMDGAPVPGHPTLSDPTFSIKTVNNGNPPPSASWSTEIALDVEWAHAIAPQANIDLVEANSSLITDLVAAVNTAKALPGVVAVSMSWGGSELSNQTSLDSTFTTPANHQGVTFVAASGDSGLRGGAEWPSSSPNVLGVGGTTLTLNSGGVYQGEAGWSYSGGGTSAVETRPAFQAGAQPTGYRQTPDVSYDANPATGFAVYNTYGSGSAWAVYGGTSAGAPQWSALIAIADQGRAAQNLSSLDGSTQTLYALYGLKSPSAGFHDVTTGSNGSILTYGYTGYRSRFGSGYGFTSTTNSATVGYDTVTGLGTPAANVLVPALVGVTGTGRTLAFNVVATTPAAATSTASTTGATAHFDPTSPIVIITNPGSSTTSPISSPTPTPTQSQSQTLIVIIPVGTGSLARSTTFIILLAPANLPLPTPTYYAATGHSGSFSIAANIAFLTAAPSTMIRPPQSLDIHPTYESEVPPLRSSDDEGPFPPLDYTTPALGPEFIARGESATGLDILAITRHARELGRVAARGSIELGPRATPITEPILTDLTVRDRTPTLDPALAGVVVVVGGALALRPDRSGRRRWSIRRV